MNSYNLMINSYKYINDRYGERIVEENGRKGIWRLNKILERMWIEELFWNATVILECTEEDNGDGWASKEGEWGK